MLILLALGSSIPISYGICGGNLNGYLYDATPIMANPVLKFPDSKGEYEYYVKICQDLEKTDISDPNQKQFGANAMRRRIKDNKYESIGFHDTQTYDYKVEKNPKDGFIIKTIAQSLDPESEVRLYNFVIEVQCTNDTSTEIYGEPMIWSLDEQLFVTLSYKNIYGCPKETTPPTPQPTPDPKCEKLYRSTLVYPYGINISLANMNYGPHGYPVVIDKNTFAIIQPCGETECPSEMTCSGASRSGIWVCEYVSSTPHEVCKAYGTIPSEIETLHEDPDEGVHIEYSMSNTQTKVDLSCDFQIRDSVYIQKASWDEISTLSLVLRTTHACAQPLITPNYTMCKAHLSDPTHEFDFDLTKYNKENGYTFRVDIPKWNRTKDNTFIVYQPCDPLLCPGTICPDATGGTLWLCYENYDKTSVCYDYGLYDEKINIELFSYGSVYQGVSVAYDGTQDRDTHFRYICDKSVPAGEVRFNDTVNIMSPFDDLSLVAYTSDICFDPLPTKTPVPTISPMPTKSQTPTKQPGPTPWVPPVPQPTKSPVPPSNPQQIAYTSNGTHSIQFDTKNIDIKSSVTIKNSATSDSTPMEVYLHPFRDSGCPDGKTCPYSEFPTASAYGCWKVNNIDTCYPLMLSRYGFTTSLIGSNLESGAKLTTNGMYAASLYLNAKCDQSVSGYAIDNDAIWSSPDSFTLNLRSSQACPSAQVTPIFPTPPPQPTEQPGPLPSTFVHEGRVYYDLETFSKIEMLHMKFSADMPNHNAKANQIVDFYYHPTQLLECPSKDNCTSQQATAWKCWDSTEIANQKVCVAIADLRYGLELNQDDFQYEGGYASYRLVVNAQCDPDFIELQVEGTATETINREVNVFVRHKTFCPGSFTKSTTGGAIFLLIVFGGFSLYIIVGSMYKFIREGKVAIPNEIFWMEFALYVQTGFRFITCRPITSLGASADAYQQI